MAEEVTEDFRKAAEILLSRRWVSRQQDSEAYFLIRRQEKKLREYFFDRCGWPLLSHARFYKLEKIPARPRAFMGIDEMESPSDYVLLCCTMAFLEEQEVDGQFLLSDLCEALLSYYPQEQAAEPLHWESYNWRKALIRVIRYLLSAGILLAVEDDSEAFLRGGATDGVLAGEALYEVPILARIFLRQFPRDIPSYRDAEDFCRMEVPAGAEEDLRRMRRNRVYRTLLLEPVCYRTEETEADFAYLRNPSARRLDQEFAGMFGLTLELYQDAAMAVSEERTSWFEDIFPYRMRGVHDVILHLANHVREQEDWKDKKVMSMHEFSLLLDGLSEKTSSGWTKEFREMGRKRLAETLLTEMVSWGMARRGESGIVELLPALFRLGGRYPEDYMEDGADAAKNSEKAGKGRSMTGGRARGK